MHSSIHSLSSLTCTLSNTHSLIHQSNSFNHTHLSTVFIHLSFPSGLVTMLLSKVSSTASHTSQGSSNLSVTSYDSGFGHEPHKMQWVGKSGSPSLECEPEAQPVQWDSLKYWESELWIFFPLHLVGLTTESTVVVTDEFEEPWSVACNRAHLGEQHSYQAWREREMNENCGKVSVSEWIGLVDERVCVWECACERWEWVNGWMDEWVSE